VIPRKPELLKQRKQKGECLSCSLCKPGYKTTSHSENISTV
jgi:hypothetical protein